MLTKLLPALAALILCAVPSGAQTAGQTKRPDEPAGEMLPIIDAHTHAAFGGGGGDADRRAAQARARYFKEWEEAGVVAAVAHTSTQLGNYHEFPGRDVIYCAGVGDKVNIRAIASGLSTGKYGCIKIYLGYVHRYAYSRQYEAVYRLAQRYDVPVVFHTGDTDSPKAKLKYADPLTIDEVAVDHPNVRFVIAHCGNPWIESAAEVAYKNPNVYLECSAMLAGDLNQLPRETVDTYVVRPISWIFGYVEDPGKIMFGSDWPVTNIKSYVDAYKRAIPKEHWRAVFHDNAARVFKFRRGGHDGRRP